MTGLRPLIHNEFIKSVKRSTVVLFIVMLVLTIAIGGIMFLLSGLVQDMAYDVDFFVDIDEMIDSARAEYNGSGDADSKLASAYELAYCEAQKYLLETDDYNIVAYKSAMYADVLDMYAAAKFQKYCNDILSMYPDISEQTLNEYSSLLEVDATQATVKAREYRQINSFDEYIDYMKKQIDISNLTKAQKEIERKALEYHVMIDPEGKDVYAAQSVQRYRTLAYSLEDKYDYETNNSVLPYDKASEYEKELKVLETGFRKDAETNMQRVNSEGAASAMMSISMSFVMIILIVLSGGMISSEINSGSIKSMVIAPVKRYKIILSKIITVALYGLGLTVIAYLITLIMISVVGGGLSASMPYVTSFLLVIPGPLFLLIRFLIYYFEAMVYAMFAFMLSVVTRNTSIAVAIPLLIDMVISGIISTISLFSSNHIVNTIINCLPTSHFDIVSRLFDSSALNLEVLYTSADTPSPIVSFVYLFALALGMVFLSIDTFKNRDVVK